MAAAKEITADAAIASVSSELDTVFSPTLKEQRTTPKAFFSGQRVFALLPGRLWQEFS